MTTSVATPSPRESEPMVFMLPRSWRLSRLKLESRIRDRMLTRANWPALTLSQCTLRRCEGRLRYIQVYGLCGWGLPHATPTSPNISSN